MTLLKNPIPFTTLLFILLFTGKNFYLLAQSNPVNIPGTHLSIIPPEGYKISKDFKGLEKNKDVFIKAYDPYNSSYIKYASTFTRESLENGGSEVQDYKKLNISGFQAKYAALQNNAGGESYYLVFGDSSFSVMLVASCPANRDTDERQLKTALLSTTYNKNLKTNPLAGAFFKITDTNSAYRFAECKKDYYIYSAKGAIKNDYSGESIISVLPFTSEYTVGDEAIQKAILSAYSQYGITEDKVKKETQVQIDGISAMEAEINAKINNKKAVLYRLALVNGEKAILILGIATSDFDKNIDAFRNFAHAAKLK